MIKLPRAFSGATSDGRPSLRSSKSAYLGLHPLEGEAVDNEDAFTHEYEPLPANVYGWAISTVIRDPIWLSSGTRLMVERTARIVNSITIIMGTIGVQGFLLFAVSRLLCEKQVKKIRSAYSLYEVHMYPNATYTNKNGYERGIVGKRQVERFLSLDPDFAESVCEIPLSHPFYLAAILLIWTFTCQVELRTIFETSFRLFYQTPTVASLQDMLKRDGDEEESDKGEERNDRNVHGLTAPLKVFLAFFVQLPRVVTLLSLLWLGARWLTATIGLDDVLLNGLALEFMVLLQELFYNVCISHRNRAETERLYVRPFREVNKASCVTFFDAQIWGLISIVFVYLYIFHLQMVLPDYHWDVGDACSRYLLDMELAVRGHRRGRLNKLGLTR